MTSEDIRDVVYDPDREGREHRPEDDPAERPEEYEPEPEIDEPVREASPADVADQLAEVPELADDETEDGEDDDAS